MTGVVGERERGLLKFQTTYGWGPYRPLWVQRLHNPICLVISLAASHCVHGMLEGGFVPAALSSIQLRFRLTDQHLAAILNAYKILSVLTILAVAHWGNYGHKGQWLGIGAIFYSLGAFVWSWPQFFVDPYDPSGSQYNPIHCQHNSLLGANESGICATPIPNEKEAGIQNYVAFFILGQILIGVGTAPGFILGFTYVDDNVSQHRSPKLLGLLMASSSFGPFLGTGLASWFLGYWGDLDKNTNQTENSILQWDHGWYGAWWLGFLVCAFLGLFSAISLLGFARKLPGMEDEHSQDVDQTFDFRRSNIYDRGLRDIPKTIWALAHNPVLVCLVLVEILLGATISSTTQFLPKLVQSLFRVSSDQSALITGLCAVFPAAVGALFGGWVVGHFKLRCGGYLLVATLLGVFILILQPTFLLRCAPAKIAGINTHYRGSAGEVKLDNPCNLDCDNCASMGFRPVCDERDHLSYFSPCYAGCKDKGAKAEVWEDCSCLNGTWLWNRRVVERICPSYCSHLPAFLFLLGLMCFLQGMQLTAVQQSFLRVVGFNQRTLGLSLSWLLSRILGAIPGTFVFAALVSAACEFREKDILPLDAIDPECPASKLNSCVHYDVKKLSSNLVMYTMVLKAAAVLLLASAVVFYRKFRRPMDSSSSNSSIKQKPKTKGDEKSI